MCTKSFLASNTNHFISTTKYFVLHSSSKLMFVAIVPTILTLLLFVSLSWVRHWSLRNCKNTKGIVLLNGQATAKKIKVCFSFLSYFQFSFCRKLRMYGRLVSRRSLRCHHKKFIIAYFTLLCCGILGLWLHCGSHGKNLNDQRGFPGREMQVGMFVCLFLCQHCNVMKFIMIVYFFMCQTYKHKKYEVVCL